MNLFAKIKNVTYTKYDISDMANGWEVKSILDNEETLKEYFSDYNFSDTYQFQQFSDYYFLQKICSMKSFEDILVQDIKEQFLGILEFLNTRLELFSKAKVIEYINREDINVFDVQYEEHGLIFELYKDLNNYGSSITTEAFIKAMNFKPHIVFDEFEVYKPTLKIRNELYEVLFSEKHIDFFILNRLEMFIETAIYLFNIKTMPLYVYERINTALVRLGDKIVSETTLENVIENQIQFKYLLKYFYKIKSPKYTEYLKSKNSIDILGNEWLEQNGHSYKHSFPMKEIMEQIDDQSIHWQHKQIQLTHSKDEASRTLKHFYNIANNEARKSVFGDLFATNIDINDNFSMMHQQTIQMIHQYYLTILNYFVGSEDKLRRWGLGLKAFIDHEVSYFRVDNKSKINDDFIILIDCCKNFIFEEDETKINKKVYDSLDFTIKFIESFLRYIYIAMLDSENKFYDAEKITLGLLLDCYDDSNPLRKFMDNGFMHYLRFYLIEDVDKKGNKVGMNLRNLIAHNKTNMSEFNKNYGYLGMLLLTGICNEFFLKIELPE